MQIYANICTPPPGRNPKINPSIWPLGRNISYDPILYSITQLTQDATSSDESEGHPLCIQGNTCQGNSRVRIWRHMTDEGKEGDLYCQVCWFKIQNVCTNRTYAME